MRPPQENMSAVGNVSFEDPALICSDFIPPCDLPSSETVEVDYRETDFNLQGPSEIT